MVQEIQYSKLYELKLSDLYGGKRYKCTIIGITNIDNVMNNQNDYNIYETFFKSVGLGLTSYYTAIQKNTPIYICKLVESLEPLTITDEKIFIPKTILDLENSIEYVECSNYNFNIYPIIKRFVSENERSEYISEIKTKLKRVISRLIDFSILDSDIDVSFSPIYLSNEDINSLEEKRIEAFNAYNKRISDESNSQTEKINYYNKVTNEALAERDLYIRKNELLDSKISELQTQIDAYRKAMDRLNNT